MGHVPDLGLPSCPPHWSHIAASSSTKTADALEGIKAILEKKAIHITELPHRLPTGLLKTR